MRYRIGFKNGMVVTIEAHSITAVDSTNIKFRKDDDVNKWDAWRYVNASQVLFVAPVEDSDVERGAVRPTSEK